MEQYIVETASGKIKGYERNGNLEYLGIPYAKPPVGELRFKRACPVIPWDGILDAREYGQPSVQLENGELKGNENCLTLNIKRPREGGSFPVMVWIHGGGYNIGSTSVPLYSGDAFVNDGILFVSIQYRLNVLGFYDFTTYKYGDMFESNCGISDQIMAMRWIHENIAAFGGDPNRVTIAGESAGGTSVSNMLAIPAVKGMFQQAIVQSAIPNGIFTHDMAREDMDLFMEGMGWTEEDLPKLLTMDPFEMQKGNTYVAETFQAKNPGIYLPSPVLDDLIPVRPLEAIKKGSAKGVKVIVGTNLHEASMFVRPENTVFPNTWSMIEEMFRKNGIVTSFTKVKEYYQSGKYRDFNGIEGGIVQFSTDFAFQVPAYQLAEGQKQYEDVWMYRYEFMNGEENENSLGASHAFELPSVFFIKDFEFSEWVFEGVPEEKVDSIMQSIHQPWVNFIKTGIPDSDHWPKYEGYDSPICIFDEEPRTAQAGVQELMQVWENLRFYQD